jgi:hypothetical protein
MCDFDDDVFHPVCQDDEFIDDYGTVWFRGVPVAVCPSLAKEDI